MSKPQLDPNTGYLPPGIHPHTLDEVREAFAYTEWREQLLDTFTSACENLWSAGADDIYLAGSFLSSKSEPDDIDGIWVVHPNIDRDQIDPLLLDDRLSPVPGEPGKEKFRMWHEARIEMWQHPTHMGTEHLTLIQLFQLTKEKPPRPRGIIYVLKPPNG